MFKLMLKYFIGGETGKRESALMALTFWFASCVYVAVKEAQSVDLPATVALITLATPFVWAWVAAAFGFQWVSKQTGWGK